MTSSSLLSSPANKIFVLFAAQLSPNASRKIIFAASPVNGEHKENYKIIKCQPVENARL